LATFAGIAPRDVAPFIIAQLVGAFAGMLVVAALGVPNRISSPLEIQLDSAPDLSAS
jgi:glycerol uptake facilitator-like aquaporin